MASGTSAGYGGTRRRSWDNAVNSLSPYAVSDDEYSVCYSSMNTSLTLDRYIVQTLLGLRSRKQRPHVTVTRLPKAGVSGCLGVWYCLLNKYEHKIESSTEEATNCMKR